MRRIRAIVGLAVMIGAALLTAPSANAASTVSDYLRDGWEIKAGYYFGRDLQVLILQKNRDVVHCYVDMPNLPENIASTRWCTSLR